MVFDSLKLADIHKIIDIELKSLYGRIDGLGYSIKITQEAKTFIADRGYDQAFGARPLKRAIQKHLEDPLAEAIIKQPLAEGDVISVSLDKNKEKVKIKISKPRGLRANKAKKEEKKEEGNDTV